MAQISYDIGTQVLTKSWPYAENRRWLTNKESDNHGVQESMEGWLVEDWDEGENGNETKYAEAIRKAEFEHSQDGVECMEPIKFADGEYDENGSECSQKVPDKKVPEEFGEPEEGET